MAGNYPYARQTKYKYVYGFEARHFDNDFRFEHRMTPKNEVLDWLRFECKNDWAYIDKNKQICSGLMTWGLWGVGFISDEDALQWRLIWG